MTTDDQILAELQKINKQLQKQQGHFLKNLLAGFSYSFGYLAGTILIFSIVALYASRLNWPDMIGRSVDTMMARINWTQLIPVTPSSAPLPDQP